MICKNKTDLIEKNAIEVLKNHTYTSDINANDWVEVQIVLTKK